MPPPARYAMSYAASSANIKRQPLFEKDATQAMIKRIDHIAIVVQDLDAALKVYRDALGLPLTHVRDVPAEGVKVAFLPMPEGDGEIELVQPTAEETGIARYLAKRGEGMHHICVEVDD